MGQPTFIAMNERILGLVSGTPLQILQGQMTSSPTWPRRENLGSRSSKALSNPVLIITSFHIYKVAKGIHK